MVVRAPNGRPIAKGGVDYTAKTGVGLIWQVATREEFRSLGIGGLLIGELERRMQRRGLELRRTVAGRSGSTKPSRCLNDVVEQGRQPQEVVQQSSRSPDRGWESLAADRPTARRVGNPGGERVWSGSSAKWSPRRGGSQEFTR